MMQTKIFPKSRSLLLYLVICILMTSAIYFGSWLISYKSNVIMEQTRDVFSRDKAAFPSNQVFRTSNLLLRPSNQVLRISNQVRHHELTGKKQTDKNLTLIRERRLKYVRKECKKRTYRYVSRKNLDYILVNDKYKILLCYIPKVACSQWKKIFLLMTGKFDSNPDVLDLGNVHTEYIKYLNFLSTYSSKGVRFRLKNYKKAIFLRDPLERLLSAYRNKMTGTVHPGTSFSRIRRYIVKNYRANTSDNEYDVTFQEFLNYVLDYKITTLNDHWQKYTNLCHPCYIDYNFIGKFETLEEDANFLLKSLGVPSNITFQSRSKSYNTPKTIEMYNQFYSSVKLESILRLWDIYKGDYELFGYSFIDALKPLSSNRTDF